MGVQIRKNEHIWHQLLFPFNRNREHEKLYTWPLLEKLLSLHLCETVQWMTPFYNTSKAASETRSLQSVLFFCGVIENRYSVWNSSEQWDVHWSSPRSTNAQIQFSHSEKAMWSRLWSPFRAPQCSPSATYMIKTAIQTLN